MWALRQIAFQLERSGAPTYRVRAFRRAAEVVAGLGQGELAARERAGTLQELTGIEPSQLRARAADPTVLAGVLDYLLGNEADLLAFCSAVGIDPAQPARARRLLPGYMGP